jgi:hypothetical protein
VRLTLEFDDGRHVPFTVPPLLANLILHFQVRVASGPGPAQPGLFPLSLSGAWTDCTGVTCGAARRGRTRPAGPSRTSPRPSACPLRRRVPLPPPPHLIPFFSPSHGLHRQRVPSPTPAYTGSRPAPACSSVCLLPVHAGVGRMPAGACVYGVYLLEHADVCQHTPAPAYTSTSTRQAVEDQRTQTSCPRTGAAVDGA